VSKDIISQGTKNHILFKYGIFSIKATLFRDAKFQPAILLMAGAESPKENTADQR